MVLGSRSRKPVVNQRSMLAPTMAVRPFSRAKRRRSSHILRSGKWLLVLESTMRSKRSGALAPSHMPSMPPIDSPHQLTFLNPSPSSTASASRASPSMATAIEAQEPEMLLECFDLRLPHRVRGAERVRQHQDGRVLGPFDHDIDWAAVGVDRGHRYSRSNWNEDPS